MYSKFIVLPEREHSSGVRSECWGPTHQVAAPSLGRETRLFQPGDLHDSASGKQRRGISATKEGNVLFNDALNTFYLRLYGVGHMVEDHSDSEIEREMFYLTTHSTHFIYGYMASDIWLRTIQIV